MRRGAVRENQRKQNTGGGDHTHTETKTRSKAETLEKPKERGGGAPGKKRKKKQEKKRRDACEVGNEKHLQRWGFFLAEKKAAVQCGYSGENWFRGTRLGERRAGRAVVGNQPGKMKKVGQGTIGPPQIGSNFFQKESWGGKAPLGSSD